MKRIAKVLFISLAAISSAACIKEVNPATNVATGDQVAKAPGSYDLMVKSVTSTLCGQFLYGGSDYDAFDFGLPSLYLMRDIMGQDVVYKNMNNWYQAWYTCSHLGPSTAYSRGHFITDGSRAATMSFRWPVRLLPQHRRPEPA